MSNTQNPPEKMMFQLSLRRRGISDQAVLRAMEEIPREMFVKRSIVPRPTATARSASPAGRPSASPSWWPT